MANNAPIRAVIVDWNSVESLATALREKIREANALREALSRMLLEDPWVVDRVGDGKFLECVYCQTYHGHMSDCPHEEARALLAGTE